MFGLGRDRLLLLPVLFQVLRQMFYLSDAEDSVWNDDESSDSDELCVCSLNSMRQDSKIDGCKSCEASAAKGISE